MKTLRSAVAIGTVGLMTLGYAFSQVRYFQGRWQEWAAQVDQKPVALLATVLLLALVVLALIPEREAEPK